MTKPYTYLNRYRESIDKIQHPFSKKEWKRKIAKRQEQKIEDSNEYGKYLYNDSNNHFCQWSKCTN